MAEASDVVLSDVHRNVVTARGVRNITGSD